MWRLLASCPEFRRILCAGRPVRISPHITGLLAQFRFNKVHGVGWHWLCVLGLRQTLDSNLSSIYHGNLLNMVPFEFGIHWKLLTDRHLRSKKIVLLIRELVLALVRDHLVAASTSTSTSVLPNYDFSATRGIDSMALSINPY